MNIEKNPDKSDNPISDYLSKEFHSYNKKENDSNRKKVSALYTELSGIRIYFKNLLASSKGRHFKVLTDCINLYLSTYYIDFGEIITKSLFELRNKIHYSGPSYLNQNRKFIFSLIMQVEELMLEIK